MYFIAGQEFFLVSNGLKIKLCWHVQSPNLSKDFDQIFYKQVDFVQFDKTC